MNTPIISSPSLKNLSNQSVYTLQDSNIIGRHEDCNLVLKSERGASRKHARITLENNNAVLMDLGSLNGTTVNGREISRAVQLVDGDIVVFDEQHYMYIAGNTTAQNAAAENPADNVTVVANQAEVGRPESIQPAIRVVENSETAPLAESSPLDDTEAWEIPTTSRPGGEAIKSQQNNAEQSLSAQNNRRNSNDKGPSWFSWSVIIPSLILLMLVAFYFAYTTGLTAGLSVTPPTSS